MKPVTWNVIPLCPVGDTIFKGLVYCVRTIWLPNPHHRVVTGIHQGQVAEQTIILRLTVVALLLVGSRVIKRVAGNHRATVQVSRQHKTGKTMKHFRRSTLTYGFIFPFV